MKCTKVPCLVRIGSKESLSGSIGVWKGLVSEFDTISILPPCFEARTSLGKCRGKVYPFFVWTSLAGIQRDSISRVDDPFLWKITRGKERLFYPLFRAFKMGKKIFPFFFLFFLRGRGLEKFFPRKLGNIFTEILLTPLDSNLLQSRLDLELNRKLRSLCKRRKCILLPLV